MKCSINWLREFVDLCAALLDSFDFDTGERKQFGQSVDTRRKID